MFLPCLALIVFGVAILAVAGGRPLLMISAVVFGIGFGSAYPLYLAHMLQHVAENRRGAAFGELIGAFDTGIGTGSIAMGWIIQHYGFGRAFGHPGVLAALSIPYFLFMEKRQWTT